MNEIEKNVEKKEWNDIGKIKKKLNNTEIEILKQRYPVEGASKDLAKTLNISKASLAYNAKKHNLSLTKEVRSKICRTSSGVGKFHKDFKGYEEISGHYISLVKQDAKKRNIIHPLLDNSLENNKYLWNLYISQNKKCVYTNEKIYFRSNVYENGKYLNATASLDRIDSSKGYIEGNVQWVHKDVNRMKWQLSQEEFILNCNKIAKKHPR